MLQTLQLSSEDARLQTEVRLEVNESAVYRISVDSLSKEVFLERGSHSILFDRTIDSPKLWWCNGLESHISIHPASVWPEPIEGWIEKDHRFGIRTIELVREEDSIGTSFFFQLNGRPVLRQRGKLHPSRPFSLQSGGRTIHRLAECGAGSGYEHAPRLGRRRLRARSLL